MPSIQFSSHGVPAGRRAPRPENGAVAWVNIAVLEWMRARLSDAGSDPSIIPDQPLRFLRLPEVESLTGLARSSLYRRMESGSFPRPVRLDMRHPPSECGR